MKNELPLTDRDFANVRKSVMAAIETRQARRVWTIRAMRLAFAVLVLAAGAWWMIRPTAVPAIAPPNSIAPQTAQAPNNTTPPPLQQLETPQQPAAPSLVATRDQHHNRTTWTASRRQHHQTPVHEIATLTEPLRLELRTDDPDIRIIWITNPTPNSR
jgi:cytoskeletal protein RodZ